MGYTITITEKNLISNLRKKNNRLYNYGENNGRKNSGIFGCK